MTRGIPKATHIGCKRALELITAEPGLQREQIASRIKCSASHAGNLLRALKAEGLIGVVPIGGTRNGAARGWYAADVLQKAIDDRLAEVAAIRKKNSLIGIAKMQQRAKTGEESDSSGMPVHRLVKAKSKRPLPFVCKAPNSVFALGGKP